MDYIPDLLIISILLNIYLIFRKQLKKDLVEPEIPEMSLTFLKGKDERIVARNNDGKVCLFDITYCKENHIYVKENETWRCTMKEEKESCIIVQPITRIMTASDNAEMMGERLVELQKKYKRM